MKIEIRYIDRTCLNAKAYMKLLAKFGNLKLKTIIVFDKRVKSYGQYSFNSVKRIHTIRISPDVHKLKKDYNAEKYELISTTLHELRHAQQKEEKGFEFWKKQYNSVNEIKTKTMSDFYSECELDARTFENANVANAVGFYNSHL